LGVLLVVEYMFCGLGVLCCDYFRVALWWLFALFVWICFFSSCVCWWFLGFLWLKWSFNMDFGSIILLSILELSGCDFRDNTEWLRHKTGEGIGSVV
jgi:hypothetical protein